MGVLRILSWVASTIGYLNQSDSNGSSRGYKMPNKSIVGLAAPRRSRPKTSAQKRAGTAADVRQKRLENLAKARRVRKKNLRAKAQAAKPK